MAAAAQMGPGRKGPAYTRAGSNRVLAALPGEARKDGWYRGYDLLPHCLARTRRRSMGQTQDGARGVLGAARVLLAPALSSMPPGSSASTPPPPPPPGLYEPVSA